MNITDNMIQQAVSNNSKPGTILKDGILTGLGVSIYSSEAVSQANKAIET